MIKKSPNYSLLTIVFFFIAEVSFGQGSIEFHDNTVSNDIWWQWPIILFLFSIFVGFMATLSGIGGAIIYVPFVSSIFPLHLDYIRGTGLVIALTGALYASPDLLKNGLANLRLALPFALIASISALFGAYFGLSLDLQIVQLSLGILLLFIVSLMLLSKKSEFPVVEKSDRLSEFLKIKGVYHEKTTSEDISWKIHRSPFGLILFFIIGFLAGMFGIGAGWANIPVLNLILGTPLKIAIGTSKLILSVTDTSAAWVYLNSGSILPLVTIPSVLGMIIGTKLGVKILLKTNPAKVKWVVIMLLLLSSIVSIVKGIQGG